MSDARQKKEYQEEDWIDPRVEIRTSPFHGKGMFATAPIKQGETVVIWGIKEYYRTKEDAEKAAVKGKIYDQLDENLFVIEDPTKRDDEPTHFMNHSCNSNVWMKDEVTLVARKDIKVGEEITIDYALFESTDEWIGPWECICGSEYCRGKYTGKDWMLPDLQKRYKGHFSPYNNKRISKLKEQER